MSTQTIFRAGNSNVVSIPKDSDFKPGQKVVVEKDESGEFIVVRKAKETKKEKSPVSEEFKKWLDNVLEEDKEILDELKNR